MSPRSRYWGTHALLCAWGRDRPLVGNGFTVWQSLARLTHCFGGKSQVSCAGGQGLGAARPAPRQCPPSLGPQHWGLCTPGQHLPASVPHPLWTVSSRSPGALCPPCDPDPPELVQLNSDDVCGHPCLSHATEPAAQSFCPCAEGSTFVGKMRLTPTQCHGTLDTASLPSFPFTSHKLQ